MKKLLILAFLALPLFSMSQSSTVDLTEYGVPASVQTSETYPIKEVTTETGDIENKEIKIRYENGEKIVVTQLKKPLTIAVVRSEFNKILTKPNKTVSLKALVKTANELLIERTYKSDGRKIYKFMVLRVIKGKEYMIDSSEFDDLELCKGMMVLAKSIK